MREQPARRRRSILRIGFICTSVIAFLSLVTLIPTIFAQSPTTTPSHNLHQSSETVTPTPDHSGMGMEGMDMNETTTPTPDHSDMGDMGDMENTGASGHDMGPVNPIGAVLALKDAKGGQRLAPEVVGDVKEFTLTVEKVLWSILPNVLVVAYTYNGTVPGPEIRITEGDKVRIIVKNTLDEPTSVHWHGLQIPNDQDGAAGVTQDPIQPGATYTYEWTAPQTPGTFFYHTHFRADVQQTLGLYGPLIIEPRQQQVSYDIDYTVMLGEWTVKNGQTYTAMELETMLPNFFTINGRSYPSTDVINAKVGQRVLIRFIGSGQFIHPMHLHGQPFRIVATDGNPVPEAAQLTKDTLLIGPGERYDVEFVVRAPGKWLLHCHMLHHTTNDGAEVNGGGGLTLVFNVEP